MLLEDKRYKIFAGTAVRGFKIIIIIKIVFCLDHATSGLGNASCSKEGWNLGTGTPAEGSEGKHVCREPKSAPRIYGDSVSISLRSFQPFSRDDGQREQGEQGERGDRCDDVAGRWKTGTVARPGWCFVP